MRKCLIFSRGSIWEPILRVTISLFLGSMFYLVWLALFLLTAAEGGFIEVFLWLIAPIVTALGFAVGAHLFDKLIGMEELSFPRLLIWPLIGCVLGAITVYWFGPMLIVFSMLSFGAISITLREVYRRRRRSSP